MQAIKSNVVNSHNYRGHTLKLVLCLLVLFNLEYRHFKYEGPITVIYHFKRLSFSHFLIYIFHEHLTINVVVQNYF